MNLQDRDDVWALAGEYVLGVLTAEEAADVERSMATNDELRAAVRYWENRLLGLTAIADPITPTADLWTRIEQNLPSPQPARTPVRSSRLWENINFWRATSAVGLAASVVLAIGTFLRPSDPTPTFTAVLQSPETKQPGWIVQGDSRNQVQVIPLAKTTLAPNQALELWTKPNQAKRPTSLGLLPGDRSVQVPATRLPGLEAGQLFEITLEPAAGSPIGRPTGKVLFIGRAAVTQ